MNTEKVGKYVKEKLLPKNLILHSSTLYCIYLRSLACLRSKMSMFQWAEMREGGEPLPLAFQYLIPMISRPCDLDLVIISSLASKCQLTLKLECKFFCHFMKLN